ncbi:MAG: nuclear transport factor 2 family protein [Planctomycetaceae bacterium]
MTGDETARHASDPHRPLVVRLADEQLARYNQGDLDGFCACYADDVVVLAADGRELHRGLDAFRESYRRLFEQFDEVRATVIGRLVCGPHSIELERWSRVRKDNAETVTGEVLVRYTERQGKIAVAQFFGP